jgi:4-diphosphocytidyl-2-C-methyl-D-erythritol kinase
MKVATPAKINLYLRILGRRPDNFHEIETLMCPVSVFDELEFDEAPKGQTLIRVEGPSDLPADQSNSIWRAADAIRKRTGSDRGLSVLVRKRIPLGGGLAGGSSNAALTLRVLNDLWACGLAESELEELASELGSDVAFFLADGPPICSGRGERVEPAIMDEDIWAVLAYPGFGVSTPWAYKTYAANPRKGVAGRVSLSYKVRKTDASAACRLQNDLEPAVFDKYLWIAQAKEWFLKQKMTLDALMSGSGATVFALTQDAEAAAALERAARDFFGEHAWITKAELAHATRREI